MSLTIVTVLHSPDALGGTERTAHLAAASLRKAGHRVCLLHNLEQQPRDAKEYDESMGVEAFFDTRSLVRRRRHDDAERMVSEFLQQCRADVVHIHAYPRTEHINRLANQYPTVVTVHVPLCPNGSRYLWKPRCVCNRNVGSSCFTQGYLRDGCGKLGNGVPMSKQAFARAMYEDSRLRRALEACAGINVPSRWMADRLTADGFDAARMHVVSPPISEDSQPKQPCSPPVVLFVGRLVEMKGGADLIAASARISTPHQVWIAGAGPEREALEKQAIDLKVSGHVKFLGSQFPQQLSSLRAAACVAVVPSLWPETFGMTGPEAMVAGLPVVAYRAGAVPEWLNDGVTGCLVEPGNVSALASAIEKILVQQQTGDRMGAAARQVAKTWSLDRHVEKLLEVYVDAQSMVAGNISRN
ncbi:MAG: glycosyltransferase family 4 protein [Planctomycetota bacterium]|nr:glycosyltransferase family 4 protein [Planctomycetota bacterium]